MDMLLFVTGGHIGFLSEVLVLTLGKRQTLLIAGLLPDDRNGFGCISQHSVVIGVFR